MKTSIRRARGFTLIELVIVLGVIGALMMVVGVRTNTFGFWRDESFVRKLNETIVFLHHQAVTDQAFYQIEFDLVKNQYKVGVIRPDQDVDESLQDLASGVGNLSLELAAFLNPSIGEAQTIIPPPSFPSLADPVDLPPGVKFTEIRTMRGVVGPTKSNLAFVLFSPRGFSEFAVVHLELSNGSPITILVNPFTGVTETFRAYKDFEWSYGDKNKRT